MKLKCLYTVIDNGFFTKMLVQIVIVIGEERDINIKLL